MCIVEAMKLKIVQLKEVLSTAQAAAAKLNGRCEDDRKIHCDWQLVQNRGHSGPGVAETEHQRY